MTRSSVPSWQPAEAEAVRRINTELRAKVEPNGKAREAAQFARVNGVTRAKAAQLYRVPVDQVLAAYAALYPDDRRQLTTAPRAAQGDER